MSFDSWLLHRGLGESKGCLTSSVPQGGKESLFLQCLKLATTSGITCPRNDMPPRRKQIISLFDLDSRVLFLGCPQWKCEHLATVPL